MTQLQFNDITRQPLSNKKVVFTPLNPPVVYNTQLAISDPVTVTTNVYGAITASLVKNSIYKAEIVTPSPKTTFYIKTDNNGNGSIISASIVTGSTSNVTFDLTNILGEDFINKTIQLTPYRNYPVTFSGSVIVLASTSSKSNNGGNVTFSNMVPGAYSVECFGKEITDFYISVPSVGGNLNVSDLVIVNPSKATPVKINDADKSYVLTVSSSDARYVLKGGNATSATSASFAQTASFWNSSNTKLNVTNSRSSGVFAHSGSFGIKGTLSVDATTTITVSDVSAVDVTFISGGGLYTAGYGNYGVRVYAYRNVGAIRVYSANPAEFVINDTDPSTGLGLDDTYSTSVVWQGVAEADGYKLLIYNDMLAVQWDYEWDVGNCFYVQDDAIAWTPGVVITPTSPQVTPVVSGSINLTGSLKVTGSITCNSMLGTASYARSSSVAATALNGGYVFTIDNIGTVNTAGTYFFGSDRNAGMVNTTGSSAFASQSVYVPKTGTIKRIDYYESMNPTGSGFVTCSVWDGVTDIGTVYMTNQLRSVKTSSINLNNSVTSGTTIALKVTTPNGTGRWYCNLFIE